jgi:hypothetical protein
MPSTAAERIAASIRRRYTRTAVPQGSCPLEQDRERANRIV